MTNSPGETEDFTWGNRIPSIGYRFTADGCIVAPAGSDPRAYLTEGVVATGPCVLEFSGDSLLISAGTKTAIADNPTTT